jgi:predicted PurR-regulated permease PerM
MNQIFRYILIALGIAISIFIIWRFNHIVSYILISAVLSLIGRPLVDLLGRLKLSGRTIPKALRALLTIAIIWTSLILFFSFIIPLVAAELEQLSQIKPDSILTALQEPISNLEKTLDRFTVDDKDRFTVQEFVTEKLSSVFSASFVSSLFSNVASALGNVFLAIFSITFITFFFLKDENLFANSILSLVPDKHVVSFKHAMESTRRLLIRYFVGICFQVFGIFTIVSVGLTLTGLGFQLSILIGLIAGTFNVIPYLGPLMGSSIGILIGIATHLHLDLYSELLPLVGWMILVFTTAQLVDNFVFQPFIFSSSVNAHPLEIFLVIMIAASLGGIVGMIIAIPFYTILRVFAKEFLNKFKVVKKLTYKIE